MHINVYFEHDVEGNTKVAYVSLHVLWRVKESSWQRHRAVCFLFLLKEMIKARKLVTDRLSLGTEGLGSSDFCKDWLLLFI